MASATLSFSPIHYPTRVRTHKSRLSLSFLPLPFQSHPFPPLPLGSITAPAKTRGSVSFAYVSGPASDPNVTESGPRVDPQDSRPEKVRPARAISWGLLWSLLGAHKLRLAISALTLLGCTTCTLSMPIFTGRFFEVLIGARPEPLWKLLSKVGLSYALEPILTVIFVTNLNTVWEKVMSTIRAQIFRRMLIQKAEFFDRYKEKFADKWCRAVNALFVELMASTMDLRYCRVLGGVFANPNLQMATMVPPPMSEGTSSSVPSRAPCGSTHSQGGDSINGFVEEMREDAGVEEGMGLSSVPCKEEYLGSGLQFGAESAEDVVPLISLPSINNIANSSSDWVLDKVNEIQQCVGITCKGFEDQFTALLTAIEAGES